MAEKEYDIFVENQTFESSFKDLQHPIKSIIEIKREARIRDMEVTGLMLREPDRASSILGLPKRILGVEVTWLSTHKN